MRRPALILLLAVALGCGAAPEKKTLELETEEVSEPIDAGMSLEDDVQAKATSESLAGVLPSDYPSDFPVYRPSSVVDFGPGFVELHTPDAPAAVRRWLAASAARAGWSGSGPYTKAGRTVTVDVTGSAGGTTLRLSY
ncbi:MAG: hypothetical protein R2991_01640 [Thermoanaerobaculia bacterium]